MSFNTFIQLQQEVPVAIAYRKAINYLLAAPLSDTYQEIDQLLY